MSAKTWLITGVSSGLGYAMAQAALGRGDRVWGTVRSDVARDAFLALGGSGASLADMGNAAAVARAVEEAEAGLGGIDVLVNNAGYGIMGAVEEVSLAEAERQFAVNLFGPLAAIQAALPAMRARGSGHIVNITSVSGLATWAGTGVYCASKFALEGLGMTLADEVAPLGLHVTHVAPGGLRTDYAGRSLARAARVIDAYAATAHQSERIVAAHLGEEPNDPAKAAQAILLAVDADPPPRHLLLGADALRYAARHAGALQAEIGDWAALSTSVGVSP